MKKRQHHSCRLNVEELEGRLVPSTLTSSTNWSGYAVAYTNPNVSGTVSWVQGSWTVPAATGSGTGYSSSWVGIDGYNSSTVEQIGTESDWSGGRASYYAWWEMYPGNSVNITSLTISPGDSITANVKFTGTSTTRGRTVSDFTLMLTDTNSQGTVTSFSTNQTISGAQRSSAEWIEEAPSSYSGVLPLANFGTVGFSSAKAAFSNSTTLDPINYSSWSGTAVNQINMISGRTGATIATTSGLGTDGMSFSVAYVPTSTSTPAPRPSPPPHRWGGGGWGWFAPNQSTTTMTLGSNMTGALTANPTLPQAVPSTPAPVPGPSATPATPLVGTSSAILPSWVRPSDDSVVDNPPANSDSDDADANKPSIPGNPSGTPAGPAAPTLENAPSYLQNISGMGPWASDVCFADGGWRTAAASGSLYSQLIGQDTGEARPLQAGMGVLLTLGLGTGWSVAREETGAKRRRPKLR